MKIKDLIELLEGLNLDQEADVIVKIGRGPAHIRKVSGVNTSPDGRPQICVYPHKEDPL